MGVSDDLLESEWLPEKQKIVTFLRWSGVSQMHFQVYRTNSQEWVIDRTDNRIENEPMPESEWCIFRARVVQSEFVEFDSRNEFYRILGENIDSWLEHYNFEYKSWRDEWVLTRLKYKLHYSNLIAERLGCARQTIQKWCRKYNISYPWRDKELMRELYSSKGMNKSEIADYLNCEEGTVAKWLSIHDIIIKKKNDGIGRDQLHSLFVEQGLSLAECGRRLGCSAGKVRYWVRKYNIEPRKQEDPLAVKYQSHKGYPCWIPKMGDSAVRIRVHRLAAVAEWGVEDVKGMSVHHKSEIPWDNRLSNLELISNEKHAKLHNSNYE